MATEYIPSRLVRIGSVYDMGCVAICYSIDRLCFKTGKRGISSNVIFVATFFPRSMASEFTAALRA